MITIRPGTTPKSKERCPLNRIIIKREQFLLQVLVFGLLRFFILVLIQHILKGRHSYGMRLFHSEPAHSKPVAVDRLGFGVLDFTCNRYCGCHDLELLLVMMMVWSLRHIENWWLQIRKRDLDVHMVIKTTCKKLVHDSRFQIQIRERHKERPYKSTDFLFYVFTGSIPDGIPVLSKCVSTSLNVRTYSTWRMSVLLRLLCTAFYVYKSAGMLEYSAELNIGDMIYINCYMHVWSNYSNMSIERAHTRLPQLTNCCILLCN